MEARNNQEGEQMRNLHGGFKGEPRGGPRGDQRGGYRRGIQSDHHENKHFYRQEPREQHQSQPTSSDPIDYFKSNMLENPWDGLIESRGQNVLKPLQGEEIAQTQPIQRNWQPKQYQHQNQERQNYIPSYQKNQPREARRQQNDSYPEQQNIRQYQERPTNQRYQAQQPTNFSGHPAQFTSQTSQEQHYKQGNNKQQTQWVRNNPE